MKKISAALIILVLMLPGYSCASVDVLAGGWWDASIEELLSAREQIDAQILALGEVLPVNDIEGEAIVEGDLHSSNEAPYFEISQFENQEFCSITTDTIESRAVINVENYDKVATLISPTDGTSRLFSRTHIYPDIYVHDYGKATELPVLRIIIDFSYEDWLFADSAVFKLGDVTYTFNNIGSDSRREVGTNGYVYESLVILIGNENKEFIEAICEGKSDLLLRIKGTKGSKDFEVNRNGKFFSDVKQMYDTMLSAGGFDQVYLQRIPSSSMIIK